MASTTMCTTPLSVRGAAVRSSKARVAPALAATARRAAPARARVVKTEALDSTVIGGVLAGAAGIAVGLGVPIFFSKMEQRDKERLEEIRELNRANLKATGETLPEMRAPKSADRASA